MTNKIERADLIETLNVGEILKDKNDPFGSYTGVVMENEDYDVPVQDADDL